MRRMGIGLTLFQILVVSVVCALNPYVILEHMGVLILAVIASTGPSVIASSPRERNAVLGLILEGLYLASLIVLWGTIQYNIVIW